MRRRGWIRPVIVAISSLLLLTLLPSVVSAENAACEDAGPNNRWAGNYRNNTGWVSYGTKATVNPAATTFVPCIGSGGPLSVDGPAAWVAVTAASGDFNSIIQIGIINCNAPLVGVCDRTGAHYFYADGAAVCR
jgi:hypothetical protein